MTLILLMFSLKAGRDERLNYVVNAILNSFIKIINLTYLQMIGGITLNSNTHSNFTKRVVKNF